MAQIILGKVKGDKGDKGEQGLQGIQGIQGEPSSVNDIAAVEGNITLTAADILNGATSVATQINSFAPHLTDLVTDADGAHGLKIEIGTWTPALSGSTVAGTFVTSILEGKYYKIGKLTYVQGRIRITSITDATGNLVIGGLPFLANSAYALWIERYGGITLPAGYTQAAGYTSGTNIFPNMSGSNVVNRIITISNLTPQTDFFFSCIYLIN